MSAVPRWSRPIRVQVSLAATAVSWSQWESVSSWLSLGTLPPQLSSYRPHFLRCWWWQLSQRAGTVALSFMNFFHLIPTGMFYYYSYFIGKTARAWRSSEANLAHDSVRIHSHTICCQTPGLCVPSHDGIASYVVKIILDHSFLPCYPPSEAFLGCQSCPHKRLA